MAPVSEQPQAEETSRASSLLPHCFRSASALLPLCFHPASTLCPTGCSCSCRSSTPTSRSSSRWAPPSPPPHGKPAWSHGGPVPRPQLSSASALRPQQPPPGAPSGWRTCHLPLWSPWSRPYLPLISLDLPRSQARDQRRATSTGVPPQRQGGGAALPRGALPVLPRLARSVRERKPGGRVPVIPRWQPLENAAQMGRSLPPLVRCGTCTASFPSVSISCPSLGWVS